jgi:cytoskeleton protein RodZ
MATSKTKASGAARQKNNTDQASATPLAATLGTQFREAREARDLSIDTVANELMIRKFYLTSLEEGAYRNLPERVYAVGFVKTYAELLGLDQQSIVEQFKREAYGSRAASVDRIELNMPTPTSQSMLPPRGTIFAIGACLALLIIGGLIWSNRSDDPVGSSIPQPPAAAQTGDDITTTAPAIELTAPDGFAAPAPVPETTSIVSSEGTVTTTDPASVTAPADASATTTEQTPATETVPTPAAPAAQAPVAPTATTAPEGTRILVEALQPSWVEIADAEGNILYTNILRVGQALPIPNKPGMTLTTGNASGVQLVLDGKKLGPLGRAGEVKRSVVLDPERLNQR